MSEAAAEFTLRNDELERARSFYEKPELTATDFRKMIVNALSFGGNKNPTQTDIEKGKQSLLESMDFGK